MKLRAQIEEAVYEATIQLNQAKKYNDEEMANIYRGYIRALTWALTSRGTKDMPADLPYIPPKD